MTILELNHVALHVADVAVSCAFYEQVLRLQPMARPDFDFPGAWFRLGDQELHLIGGRSRPAISGNRGDHFALRVNDLPAWEKHLHSIGADYRPPKKRPDGAWQIFLNDPDGHCVELCSLP